MVFLTNSMNSAPAEFTLVSPEQDEETGLTQRLAGMSLVMQIYMMR